VVPTVLILDIQGPANRQAPFLYSGNAMEHLYDHGAIFRSSFETALGAAEERTEKFVDISDS
jgi:hypothetical protein